MEKPIIFNAEMVKAILDGRKTVARRIIKRTPSNDDPCGYGFWKEFNECDNRWYVKDYTHSSTWWTLEEYISRFSKYHVGDILWVRETWNYNPIPDDVRKKDILSDFLYKANENDVISKYGWRPSIHMPKEAARIFLKVTDVRVEQLQDITEEDILREGTNVIKSGYDRNDYKFCFNNLWDSTCIKEDYRWKSNPWVWVIEFERVE